MSVSKCVCVCGDWRNIFRALSVIKLAFKVGAAGFLFPMMLYLSKLVFSLLLFDFVIKQRQNNIYRWYEFSFCMYTVGTCDMMMMMIPEKGSNISQNHTHGRGYTNTKRFIFAVFSAAHKMWWLKMKESDGSTWQKSDTTFGCLFLDKYIHETTRSVFT